MLATFNQQPVVADIGGTEAFDHGGLGVVREVVG
jgi:hypothetical protein